MSLFGSRKRKNAAEQEERAWNQNRPADYVNQQKDAMDAVTNQVGSGFDWNTGDEAYQNYRKLNAATAQGAADNAKANAALLSGGYGSSYADSVAQQGQRETLAGIDNALPSLRGQALTEYQNQQTNLLNALSGMASTEALDRSAYGANLSNYDAWKNFLSNQTSLARSEYASDKENAWNWLKNIGSTVLGAYDTYKGFSQQRMQLQTQAINYAAQLKQQGADDMAKAVLQIYKVDPSILDSWDGQSPITWQDQLSGIATASGLMGNGDEAGAYSYLDLLNLPHDTVSDYATIAGRAFDQYAQKQLYNKSLSGSSTKSSKSSGSSGTSGGWTNSQILSVKKARDEAAANGEDTTWYDNILNEAGRPMTSTTTSGQSDRSNYAALLAKNYAKKGYSPWAIMNNMHENGYTDDEIAQALEDAGVKY